MELQRRTPAHALPTWRKMALSGLRGDGPLAGNIQGRGTEEEFWGPADFATNHALAVASGVKWIPGRGWIPAELGDMEAQCTPGYYFEQGNLARCTQSADDAWKRASAFYEQATQIVRNARAANMGMQLINNQWVKVSDSPVPVISIADEQAQLAATSRGTGTSGGPLQFLGPGTSVQSPTGQSVFALPGGSILIGGTEIPWLLIGGGLLVAYFMFMRGK